MNVAKCSFLSNTAPIMVTLGDVPINQEHEIRDLGVRLSHKFTPTTQCIAAANKAKRALFVLRGAISSRDANIWIPMYCMYVRPHLEYCVQAWSPYLKKNGHILEKVQRMTTRWVSGMKGLDYKERLSRLGLFSLERRRLRGDLIEVFKRTRDIDSLQAEDLLKLRGLSHLRGHNLMLEKQHCNLEVRKGFFAHRVVNSWNILPGYVVNALTLDDYKRQRDDSWAVFFPDLL